MPERPVGPRAVVLPLVAAVLLAGCGDDIVLPPASQVVLEQQITLYALSNTGVQEPSAYNMLIPLEVRTDETTDFDFAFEIGPDSALGVGTTGDTVAVLMPRGTLGFVQDGGLQKTAVPYDSIVRGILDGYVRDVPTVIDSGDVVLAASRLQACNYNVYRPLVAKMRVDGVDFAARTANIRVTIDPNCGYLSLVPGQVPKD
jgi:hypothetical protein